MAQSPRNPPERLPARLETMSDFYDLMTLTRDVRRQGFHSLERDRSVDKIVPDVLAGALRLLEELPLERTAPDPGQEEFPARRLRLTRDSAAPFVLRPGYEITELRRDIAFLLRPPEEFSEILGRNDDRFSQEAAALADWLNEDPSSVCLATDRDGTVNNYCGRYRSSIQSLYNAVWLREFITRRTAFAVVLTSAPLTPDGLLEVSVMPFTGAVAAGSKGRDFLDDHGNRHRAPLHPEQEKALADFNDRLRVLLAKKRNRPFALIGSGVQFKFGQTTAAYQDIDRSIPEEESVRYASRVRKLVDRCNGRRRVLFVEDTGLDLEIMVGAGRSPKDFDKGDGLAFINGETGGPLDQARVLVCGDTLSDVPMIRYARLHAREVLTIFVTRDERVRRAVLTADPQARFASSPDVLVAALHACASGRSGDHG